MEFTEAESNMNDLVSEYQQYQARPCPTNCPRPVLLGFHVNAAICPFADSY